MVCLWYMKKHKHTIRLSNAEVIKLQSITTKGAHNVHVVVRARILLLSNRGVSKNGIAKRLDTNRSTVQRIRDYYRKDGLDRALHDAPRPGRPRKITANVEAHLVATACSKAPEGFDHWTLEMLQKELIAKKKVKSISQVAIWYHLDERGIKPWREKNVVRTEAHA